MIPVVEAIRQEPLESWEIDVSRADDYPESVLALYQGIRKAFTIDATETLVTKTMLGVFGCTPAFDQNFRSGFRCYGVTAKTLRRVAAFYHENAEEIDGMKIKTLDVDTGNPTTRLYPRAKIIDMTFFQSGGGSPTAPSMS